MNNIKITQNNIWTYYPKSFAAITPMMQQELLKYTSNEAFGDVLDAGCGVGKILPNLVKNNKVKNIFAVDYEKNMLEESKNQLENLLKISNKNITFLIGDVTNLNFENEKFDSITSLNVLYALKYPEKFIEESFRILKKNGKLIISSPTENLVKNSKILETEVEKEFSKHPQYKIFKECNIFLMSQFKPKLFSVGEMEKILCKIGYKIEKIEKSHYLNSNFTIIAKK